MLKARLIKFEYTRNKPSVRYVLLCQRWDKHRDLIAYDITNSVLKALQEDAARGEGETGRNFGWVVHKALQAGDAHIEVLGRWNKSKSLEDREFHIFKKWFMINAKRSVDVYDWTKNLVEPDFDEWHYLDKIDVAKVPYVESHIDFKPRIGLDNGTWRNYKTDYIKYIKEWQL